MNHANKEIKILLVEDTKIIQTITKLMLREFNCHLDIAEYGEKAVKLATKNDYDLILMDIDLPDINGLEATRRIRQAERQTKHNAVIVALTSHSAISLKSKCLTAGMDYFLQKPLTREVFAELLKKFNLD